MLFVCIILDVSVQISVLCSQGFLQNTVQLSSKVTFVRILHAFQARPRCALDVSRTYFGSVPILCVSQMHLACISDKSYVATYLPSTKLHSSNQQQLKISCNIAVASYKYMF